MRTIVWREIFGARRELGWGRLVVGEIFFNKMGMKMDCTRNQHYTASGWCPMACHIQNKILDERPHIRVFSDYNGKNPGLWAMIEGKFPGKNVLD